MQLNWFFYSWLILLGLRVLMAIYEEGQEIKVNAFARFSGALIEVILIYFAFIAK